MIFRRRSGIKTCLYINNKICLPSRFPASRIAGLFLGLVGSSAMLTALSNVSVQRRKILSDVLSRTLGICDADLQSFRIEDLTAARLPFDMIAEPASR